MFDSFESRSKLGGGYILDRRHWHKGYDYGICMGLSSYSFDRLKVESLIVRMYAENIPSVKLSEKCGMLRINAGITEKNEDFCVYEICKPSFKL